MTTLTQLIEQYCPNGVEYVRLGDVAEIARKTCQPARMGAGSVVLYSLPSFDRGEPESIDPTDIKSGKTILAKPSLLVPKLNPRKPRVWLVEEPSPSSYCSTEFFPIQADNSSLSLSYLYYVICDTISELAFLVDGGSNSHKRLNRDIYLDFLFPLPPREVQDAIAERLDAFAEFIESLDSEIALREKRFEYFREQLLTFDESDGVEHVKLGDVIELNPGTRITKARNTGTMFPVYGGGGVSFYTDDSNRSDEWVISRFAMSSHCFRYVPGKFWLLDSGITFAVRGEQSKQYIAHFLSSIQPLIYATSSKSAQRNLRVKDFLKLELPLPPREVQQEIVDKLDTMQALIDNLKQERELRRTQFEYYREKLLTFNS